MTRQNPPPGPLFRRFDASSVREAGTDVLVDATAAERDAVARECGLPGVDALAASFQVRREGTDGLRVTGRVRARLRQICVVSLDEFASDLDEPVDIAFAPEAEVEALAARMARRGAADDEPAEDLPDPIVNGRIDLGALAVEAFVLGLDPHPRKPGIAFEEPAAVESASGTSPFSALRSLGESGS